jgi:hypothetical protein
MLGYTPARHPIILSMNSDFVLPISVNYVNPDGSLGAAYNLTGWTAHGNIKLDYSSPQLVAMVPSGSLGASGFFGMVVSGSVSAALPIVKVTPAVYEIWLTSGPDVQKLLYGGCTIYPTTNQ